ncbi:MAG: NADH-quinone oxidoreductase subunit NuoK [Armatimonadota bacterium]
MSPGLPHYLTLSAALFTIGMLGVLIRRNALIIFMSIELMLNAVNLGLMAVSWHLRSFDGQMLVFFVMAVAAAEVAVGLAIIIAFFRNQQTVNVDDLNLLKW